MQSKIKQHLDQWRAGRESRSSEYFGILFGGAIVTILAIRSFLAITKYPQISTSSLHIAHVLWGGLFLLASVIVILYYHGHRAKVIGAIVAGVGLGFFIDELGKFITADNDYFYQPTPMLLYIFFVLLWLVLNKLDNYKPTTNHQRYVDMLTRLRDASIHGMTPKDKKIILNYAKQIGFTQEQKNQMLEYSKLFTPLYNQTKIQVKYYKVKKDIIDIFNRLVKHSITKKILYVIVFITAILSLSIIVNSLLTMQPQGEYKTVNTPNIIYIGIIVSCSLSFVFYSFALIKGVFNFDNLLMWYKKGLLVNIFGTQVFLFYTNQFVASFGLIGALFMLLVVDLLIYSNDNQV